MHRSLAHRSPNLLSKVTSGIANRACCPQDVRQKCRTYPVQHPPQQHPCQAAPYNLSPTHTQNTHTSPLGDPAADDFHLGVPKGLGSLKVRSAVQGVGELIPLNVARVAVAVAVRRHSVAAGVVQRVGRAGDPDVFLRLLGHAVEALFDVSVAELSRTCGAGPGPRLFCGVFGLCFRVLVLIAVSENGVSFVCLFVCSVIGWEIEGEKCRADVRLSVLPRRLK